jgi:hypothetical protein
MFGSIPATRLAVGHGAAAAWQRARAWVRAAGGRRGTAAARRQAEQAVAGPRHPRPVIVPASLDDLRGPASGVVELPLRLYWSAGSRRFDLADPHQAADLCEAILDTAATAADITAYLNADLLIRAWPAVGMSRAKRDAWESRFPVLRRQRLAAAA